MPEGGGFVCQKVESFHAESYETKFPWCQKFACAVNGGWEIEMNLLHICTDQIDTFPQGHVATGGMTAFDATDMMQSDWGQELFGTLQKFEKNVPK